MSKLLLLINPASRQGAEKFDEVKAICEELGHIVLNSAKDLENRDFSELISRYQNQAEFVLVGGGDGSINAVLPALVKTQLPLHVIPLGTANNLARTLNISSDLKDNLGLLSTGQNTRIDLGSVNGIYFVNVAGLGLSSKVNRAVSSRSKGWFGPLAFVFTAFSLINRLRPFYVEIIHPKGRHRGRSWQVTVCNGRHYGSGFTIEENACLDDGMMDCISCEVKRWWHGFLIGPFLFFGKHSGLEDVKSFKGDTFEIRTSRPRSIDIDGDIKTKTPAHFLMHPAAISVVVPRNQNSHGN